MVYMKQAIIALVLSVSSVAAAADKAPAPSVPADAKCAVAKRTVIEADGTIRIITRTVCETR